MRLESLLNDLVVYDCTPEAARQYGRLKAELRRKGRPVPQNDLQIAAVAIVCHATILTADAHFAVLPEVQVQNWLQ